MKMPHDDKNQEEQLSPLAVGYMWSTRIISLSIEMGLIILGFHWLDNRLATSPIFLVVGSFLAIGVFFFQLMGLSKRPIQKSENTERPQK